MKRRQIHRRAGRRAFTLLEVMLALGIFMLVGASLAIALIKCWCGDHAHRADQVQAATRHPARRKPAGTSQSRPRNACAGPDGTLYERSVELPELKMQRGKALPHIYQIRITAHGKAVEPQSAEVYVYQP